MAETGADLGNLSLNCPRCGRRMQYLRARTPDGDTVADKDAADATTIYVYRCVEHGPFRFSVDIPVWPGD